MLLVKHAVEAIPSFTVRHVQKLKTHFTNRKGNVGGNVADNVMPTVRHAPPQGAKTCVRLVPLIAFWRKRMVSRMANVIRRILHKGKLKWQR